MRNPFDTEQFLAAMAEKDENDPDFKLPGAEEDEEEKPEREWHEEAGPGSEPEEEDDPDEEEGLEDTLMRVFVDWIGGIRDVFWERETGKRPIFYEVSSSE
jgi:hypothetical protein